MTQNRTSQALSIAALLPALFVAGCGGDDAPRAAADPPVAETTSEAGDAEPADVSFEPAYPTDVSREGLSEADAEQQRATHSHGEEAHSDDGDDHDHDGDEGHEHGDENQDDHDH